MEKIVKAVLAVALAASPITGVVALARLADHLL